jgi:hypothetical protein
MANESEKVPVVYDDDDDGGRQRGTFVKFRDGVWSAGGVPMPQGGRYVEQEMYLVVNKWENGKVVKTITTKPLPNVDNLNAKEPPNKWQRDANSGNLKPPWSKAVVIELIDPRTYQSFRYAASTVGAFVAYNELRGCMKGYRKIEGKEAHPTVELCSVMMPTQHGKDTPRPFFKIVGWWAPNGSKPQEVADAAPKQIKNKAVEPAKPPVVEGDDELDDSPSLVDIYRA